MMRFTLSLLLSAIFTTAAAAQPAGAADIGADVYNRACKMCHGTGMMQAPRFGDRDAWAARITRGRDAMLESTLNGFNRMPARGGCAACSDDELVSALDYLLDHSR
ncbi:MAG: cytochrome c5 family protein [Gammaproteobacteria bacterium]|nr:cytochrome c5 family protein [Gammaproteobacteria bacterium]